MPLPHYNRVCCMTSETAAKVIGVLGVMGNVLTLVITSTVYGLYHEALQEAMSQKYNHYEEVTKGLFAFVVIFSLCDLILCICMLRGIDTQNSTLMLPWLISNFLFLLVSKTLPSCFNGFFVFITEIENSAKLKNGLG